MSTMQTAPIGSSQVSYEFISAEISKTASIDVVTDMILYHRHESSDSKIESIKITKNEYTVNLSIRWTGAYGIVSLNKWLVGNYWKCHTDLSDYCVYINGFYYRKILHIAHLLEIEPFIIENEPMKFLDAAVDPAVFGTCISKLGYITGTDERKFNAVQWACNVKSIRVIFDGNTRLHLTKKGMQAYALIHPERTFLLSDKCI